MNRKYIEYCAGVAIAVGSALSSFLWTSDSVQLVHEPRLIVPYVLLVIISGPLIVLFFRLLERVHDYGQLSESNDVNSWIYRTPLVLIGKCAICVGIGQIISSLLVGWMAFAIAATTLVFGTEILLSTQYAYRSTASRRQ